MSREGSVHFLHSFNPQANHTVSPKYKTTLHIKGILKNLSFSQWFSWEWKSSQTCHSIMTMQHILEELNPQQNFHESSDFAKYTHTQSLLHDAAVD